jgi:hypothetical protein
MPRLLIRTSTTKPTRKPGSWRPAFPAQRQQHRHPQQLDESGDIAGFLGDGKTGADHLRDIVNRAAEEDADRGVVETKEGDDQRIDDPSLSC